MASWKSRRKAAYQIATQTSMPSISSVDTAAPYPNRLFENDWRMMSVMSRSADGPGFDPRALPDPTDPANWEKACGRGLLLIRTFFDDVKHNATGNEITMTKGEPRASARG